MPTRDIRTTLTVDGDKKFAQAMKDAAQEMRVLKSELGEISAEFKETNDAQKFFAQRGDVLKRELAQQEEIINLLNGALKESIDKYGAASREANGYRIQLNNAQAKMHDLRRASQQADKEMEEFGRDSKKVGRQIADGIGDGVEEAADKMDGMFDKITGQLDTLKNFAGVQIAGQVGEFVVNAFQAVGSFVSDNSELNRRIAFAKYNVEKSGQNWEEINALAIRAAAVTGDYDAALAAISNLANIGFDDLGLFGAAVDALTGAVIMRGGEVDFAGLAEDLRGTIKSKVPTGTYAELIEEVLGVATVEEATKAFESAKNEQELIQIALSYLTKGGAQTSRQEWEAQNAELMDYQTKQTELALAWAELAQEMTPIVTSVTSEIINVVSTSTDFVAKMKKWYTETFPGAGSTIGQKIGEAAAAVLPEEVLKFGTTKYVIGGENAVDGVTIESITEEAKKRQEIANELDTAILAAYEETRKKENPVLANAMESAAEAAEAAQKAAEAQAANPVLTVEDLKAELGSMDAIRSRTAEENQEIFDRYDANDPQIRALYNEIAALYSMLGLDFGVALKTQTNEDGKSAGAAALEGLAEAEAGAEMAGKNFAISFANGIVAEQPRVLETLQTMMENANAILNQPAGAHGHSVYSGSDGGNQSQTAANRGMAVLQIDGHTAGRLLYNGVSEEGARRTRTMIAVG